MKGDMANVQLVMREFRTDMKAANRAIANVKNAVGVPNTKAGADAEMDTSFREMRENIAVMRKDIASIKGLQKATLWLLAIALPVFAVGAAIAKALHWL